MSKISYSTLCFWPSFPLKYNCDHCLFAISKDAWCRRQRWGHEFLSSLTACPLPLRRMLCYYTTGTKWDTQQWFWVFIWPLVRISALLHWEYIFNIPAKGLTLGIWVALASGSLANIIHRDAWIGLVHWGLACPDAENPSSFKLMSPG